jgi:hypothetical protein
MVIIQDFGIKFDNFLQKCCYLAKQIKNVDTYKSPHKNICGDFIYSCQYLEVTKWFLHKTGNGILFNIFRILSTREKVPGYLKHILLSERSQYKRFCIIHYFNYMAFWKIKRIYRQ